MDTATDPRADLGARIKRRRADLGWTQQDLSVRSGVGKPLIGLVETGRCGLSPASLERVADALGVTMDWLWRGDHA